MKIYRLFMFFLLLASVHGENEIKKFSLPPAKDMQRADLYVWNGVENPKMILVLCPGYNGNGQDLIRQTKWQEFAKENRLGLVGLSFASDQALINSDRGYYYASQGSGKLLLQGIKEAFNKELPLLLYGFSGGAHFIGRFEEWSPERVYSWCAYSAGWWDVPKKSAFNPPGIVICGDQDERYGASLIYFKQGRSIGKPWLWMSVPNVGHSVDPKIESFVREYFSSLIQQNPKSDPVQKGVWVDIDMKKEISLGEVEPSLTAWLPEKTLVGEWCRLHKP